MLSSFFNSTFAVWPIVYIFAATFLLRSKVEFVYAAAVLLVGLTVVAQIGRKLEPNILLGRWVVVLAAIGLSSAMILSIEKVEILSQPGHITSCSLSPIVACSPVIESWQASAFGLPNSFLGLVGFASVLAAGMTLLAGAATLHKWWWRGLGAGLLFALGFSGWLFFQGVFEIGTLCLYCMLVWLTSAGLWWLVLPHVLTHEQKTMPAWLNIVFEYRYTLIAATYLLIFVLIVYRWFDYWMSLLGG